MHLQFHFAGLLLSSKANVNLADSDGWTALTYASRCGSPEAVQALLVCFGGNLLVRCVKDLCPKQDKGACRCMKANKSPNRDYPGFEMEKLITLVISILRVFSNQGKVQRKEKVTEAKERALCDHHFCFFPFSISFGSIPYRPVSFIIFLSSLGCACLSMVALLIPFNSYIFKLMQLCIVYACFWTLGLDALGISWPLFGRSGFLELNS